VAVVFEFLNTNLVGTERSVTIKLFDKRFVDSKNVYNFEFLKLKLKFNKRLFLTAFEKSN
jgi:hypothetical protein